MYHAEGIRKLNVTQTPLRKQISNLKLITFGIYATKNVSFVSSYTTHHTV